MSTIKNFGNDKAEIAYKYYLTQGWTPEQASGIVGSLITESGNFSEDVINGTRKGDGGKAFGIAQWHPDRQAKAKYLYGDNWKDFSNQLKFVQWELTNSEKEAGKLLKSAKSVWEAGTIFANKYERPSLKFHADDKRQRNVADTYRKYGKSTLTDADKRMFTNYGGNAPSKIVSPSTQDFIDFETPKSTTTFADVPDVYKEPEKELISEPLQKLKENSFLEQYNQLQNQTQQRTIQQFQEPTPIMTTDVYEMAENVERLVAQQGKIIKDNQGYWNPKNRGKIIEIEGADITMKNVYEPLIGVADTGEKKVMHPNKNYNFVGATKVIEYPIISDRERAFIQQYKNKK